MYKRQLEVRCAMCRAVLWRDWAEPCSGPRTPWFSADPRTAATSHTFCGWQLMMLRRDPLRVASRTWAATSDWIRMLLYRAVCPVRTARRRERGGGQPGGLPGSILLVAHRHSVRSFVRLPWRTGCAVLGDGGQNPEARLPFFRATPLPVLPPLSFLAGHHLCLWDTPRPEHIGLINTRCSPYQVRTGRLPTSSCLRRWRLACQRPLHARLATGAGLSFMLTFCRQARARGHGWARSSPITRDRPCMSALAEGCAAVGRLSCPTTAPPTDRPGRNIGGARHLLQRVRQRAAGGRGVGTSQPGLDAKAAAARCPTCLSSSGLASPASGQAAHASLPYVAAVRRCRTAPVSPAPCARRAGAAQGRRGACPFMHPYFSTRIVT
jgi:hypothetical protein